MHLRSCQPQDDASDGTEWRQDSESRRCTTQSASTLCQLGRWQMLRTFEHAAWRRLVLLGRGDQDRLSLVACNVHPTPSARRLFPPDPCRREKEGSNGGCCWLRHVSTVAPWVDMSSTYDLPDLSCLSRSVKLPQAPLADSHASRVGVSDFPETSDCSRCSQAVLDSFRTTRAAKENQKGNDAFQNISNCEGSMYTCTTCAWAKTASWGWKDGHAGSTRPGSRIDLTKKKKKMASWASVSSFASHHQDAFTSPSHGGQRRAASGRWLTRERCRRGGKPRDFRSVPAATQEVKSGPFDLHQGRISARGAICVQ